MKLFLSLNNQQEFYCQLQQKINASITSDGFENCLLIPPQMGRGKTRTFNFASGLQLYIQENSTHEAISLEAELNYLSLVMSWMVRGTANMALGNRDCYLSSPSHHICYFNDVEGKLEFSANSSVIMVDLALESYSPLYDAIAQSSYFPPQIKKSLLNSQTGYHRQQLTTTPEMMMTLHQIVNCPYQGLTKQLYLESKALELLTLNLNLLETEYSGDNATTAVKASEVERLYRVKEILIEKLDLPPSLNSLAKQVGLNEFKLKQGFRELFDTTVFGFLHDYRMERSRLLLKSGTHNVTEVAQTVGYSNMSHFAAAFRKKYGINPSQYRKSSYQSSMLDED
ncbi:MAG: AraC family transcriptional regulator [Cyanobacteria bacterium J06623_7]